MTTSKIPTAFGEQLRYWRRRSGHSQLALAAEAGTTPRHVSFLETGRSRPGSDIVLRLAQVLDVPLRERNRLLVAAGLPPAYDEQYLDAVELAPYRRAVDRMLAAHAPFPGFVFDRHFDVIAATPAGTALLATGNERNMVRLLFDPNSAWREMLDNWDQVAAYALALLNDDLLRFPHDDTLRQLTEHANAAAQPDPSYLGSPVAHPRLRIGRELVETISVIVRFNSPVDAFSEELRMELLHPADEHAETILRQLAEHIPSA